MIIMYVHSYIRIRTLNVSIITTKIINLLIASEVLNLNTPHYIIILNNSHLSVAMSG